MNQTETNTMAVAQSNPFAAQQGRQLSTTEGLSQRQQSEVQSMMVIAKKYPRDQFGAFNSIVEACKRPSLASNACYAYPRGGQTVTGPSIRLAEVLAQAWGNLDFGIQELERRNGESTMMAYCWDMETNTRRHQIFTVKHQRDKRSGNEALTSERDIYELTANQGARRLRACILGVIPGDVVEAAIAQCEKTLSSGQSEPLKDRIRKMAAEFNAFGVDVAAIEKRLGHKITATTEHELADLSKIFISLRDGASFPSQWFDLDEIEVEGAQTRSGTSKASPAQTTQKTKKGDAQTPPATKKRTTRKKTAKKDEAPPPANDKPADNVVQGTEFDAAAEAAARANDEQPDEQPDEQNGEQNGDVTPQHKLAVWLEENGYEWRHFQLWAKETSNLPDADKVESPHELEDEFAERMMRSTAGLKMGLDMAKKMD